MNDVYCLHPQKIINPALIDFCLCNEEVYSVSEKGVLPFHLPHFMQNFTTAEIKAKLKRQINAFVTHSDVTDFCNSLGECIPAWLFVPCRHCVLCLETKKNSFAARCIMETQQHDYLPLFVTLTYRDECLPDSGLCYRHIQLFFKRFRIQFKRDFAIDLGHKFRYAVAGEYGDHTHRPHYHALLFGLPRDGRFRSIKFWNDYIASIWDKGFCLTKQTRDSNASYYVAKYSLKSEDTPSNFSCPPFHRSSINLGVRFVMDVAREVLRDNPARTSLEYLDKFSGQVKNLPLVKYYINKMFPKYTSIPCSIREAARDVATDVFGDKYLSKITIPLPYLVHPYIDIISVPDKCSHALSVLQKYTPKPFNYVENETIRNVFYSTLVQQLKSVDKQHDAYVISQRNAIQSSKSVF